MVRLLLIAVVLFVGLPALAQERGACAPGKAASDYESFEWIENNAIRTADNYAMHRNPRATFALADVDAVYQAGGEHEGSYLVKVVGKVSGGTSFAMLKPTFDFCADPSNLDTSRKDLFKVVVAKFNGRPF